MNAFEVLISAGATLIGSRFLGFNKETSDSDFVIMDHLVSPAVEKLFREGTVILLRDYFNLPAGPYGRVLTDGHGILQLLIFSNREKYDEALVDNLAVKDYIVTLDQWQLKDLKNHKYDMRFRGAGSLFFRIVRDFNRQPLMSYYEFLNYRQRIEQELEPYHKNYKSENTWLYRYGSDTVTEETHSYFYYVNPLLDTLWRISHQQNGYKDI